MKKKNPSAATIHDVLVRVGRLGGKARARNAAKFPKKRKRLSEIGRLGAAARWKKGKKA